MTPSQCRKGQRVIGRSIGRGELHGVISSVIPIETSQGIHRDIMVRWDDAPGSILMDPSELRPEPRVPVEDRAKLERWLDA